MLDLLGHPIAASELTTRLRRVPAGKGWKGGYARQPGGGPEGETCKTCEHRCRVGGGRRAYSKCGLMRAAWTHGPGSDIKLKTPACALWKAQLEEVQL